MKDLKKNLELLRKMDLCEKNSLQSAESKALIGPLNADSVSATQKEQVMELMIPEDEMLASSLFQNLVDSYHAWFMKVEFNEYFEQAWGNLFSYEFPESSSIHPLEHNFSFWMVEKMLYHIGKIYEKSNGEKISDEEQMFIGNFVTCFPSYDACSIIFRFINDFKMFMMTMYPCNVESFSVIDMIQITRIWMDARNKKKINKLERMK